MGPPTVVRLLKGPALRNNWACFKGILQRKNMDNYRYLLITDAPGAFIQVKKHDIGKKKHDIIQKNLFYLQCCTSSWSLQLGEINMFSWLQMISKFTK